MTKKYRPSDTYWHRVHLLPDETAQAAEDIGAHVVISAHNGKFALAQHTWDEPYRAFMEASRGRIYKVHCQRDGVVNTKVSATPSLYYLFASIKSIDKIVHDLNNENIICRALAYESEIAYSIQDIALQ